MDIWDAIAKDNQERVRHLLFAEIFDVSTINKQTGDTAVHLAAVSNRPECLRMLIFEAKADPNCKNDSGNTPLHLAALTAQMECARILILEAKADVNVGTNLGTKPVHYAANGQLEIMKLLLNEGNADANGKDVDGNTPLHSAAWAGQLDIMKLLISKGASAVVDCQNSFGWTPLINAAATGHFDCVKYLVEECGAGIYIKDMDDNTALDHSTAEAIRKYLDELHREGGMIMTKSAAFVSTTVDW